jgi:hypothetical protein
MVCRRYFVMELSGSAGYSMLAKPEKKQVCTFFGTVNGGRYAPIPH